MDVRCRHGDMQRQDAPVARGLCPLSDGPESYIFDYHFASFCLCLGLWHSVSGDPPLSASSCVPSAAAMARRTHPIPYRTRKLSARRRQYPSGQDSCSRFFCCPEETNLLDILLQFAFLFIFLYNSLAIIINYEY